MAGCASNARGSVRIEKGYVQDIERASLSRMNDFRQVLYTAQNCQLVVMALKSEGRDRDGSHLSSISSSAWRHRDGRGRSGRRSQRRSKRACAMLVPGWDEAQHQSIPAVFLLKLYTLYAPPNHAGRRSSRCHTRAEAEKGQRTLSTTRGPDAAPGRCPLGGAIRYDSRRERPAGAAGCDACGG